MSCATFRTSTSQPSSSKRSVPRSSRALPTAPGARSGRSRRLSTRTRWNRGIVSCARSPKREVTYKRMGRALELLHSFAPDLYERIVPPAFEAGNYDDRPAAVTDGQVLNATMNSDAIDGGWSKRRRVFARAGRRGAGRGARIARLLRARGSTIDSGLRPGRGVTRLVSVGTTQRWSVPIVRTWRRATRYRPSSRRPERMIAPSARELAAPGAVSVRRAAGPAG